MRAHHLVMFMSCAAVAPALHAQALPSAATPDAPAGSVGTPTPQDEATAPDTVQDIVVTAQKNRTNIQRTAIAISAVSGDTLRTQQVADIQGLAQSLPSVNFGQTTGNARIAIRGVGLDNISLGNEGRVAYHVDGVYVARPAAALASFYDVERVEVLRGPQGTLYGRNATGGAVNVITASPSNTLNGYAEATYGNYNLKKIEAGIGGPLADGLSARLSFQVVDRDGYGRNVTLGGDVDDQRTQAVRGQLRFHPSRLIDLTIAADYFHQDDHAYVLHYLGAGSPAAPATSTTPALTGAVPKGLRLGGVVPGDPRDVAADQRPFNKREFYDLTANLKIDLGAVNIFSIMGYRHATYHIETDLDVTSAPLSVYDQYELSKTFSQELRVAGSFGGTSEWMLGGYYFNESYFGGTRIPLDPVATGSNVPGSTLPALTSLRQGNYTMGNQSTRAYAAFGNAKIPLLPELSLRLGARYSSERKSVDEERFLNLVTPFPPFVGFFPALPPGGVRGQQEHTWSSFTPSVTLQYEPRRGLFMYATYSKGFKSGGFNLGNLQPPFAPEKITDYEAGVRADWLGGRLRTNLSAFYYDYTNLQVSQVLGATIFIQNAASARIYGLEAELSATPVRNLRLDANVSLLNSKYEDFSSVDPARAVLGAINLSGNHLTQAPSYTLNLSAAYTIPSAVGAFTIRGESRFVDRVFLTFYNLNTTSQSPYQQYNAFATWQSHGGLYASVFMRNIANKRVIASEFVSTALVGFPIVGTFEPPRTFGATLGYKF